VRAFASLSVVPQTVGVPSAAVVVNTAFGSRSPKMPGDPMQVQHSRIEEAGGH
jgi:hypothetical protein